MVIPHSTNTPREQDNKPSYQEIMKELNIEIISPICHSNLVNTENNGLKLKNLKGLSFNSHYLTILTFRDDLFHIRFLPKTHYKTHQAGSVLLHTFQKSINEQKKEVLQGK